MALFQTVPPAAEPVTLAEAKTHLRVTHDSEDALIEGLVRAARQEVEAQTCLALLDQDWRLTLDGWPATGTVGLRRTPVRSILSVTIFGEEGEAELIDPQDYVLDAVSRPARLAFRRRPAPGRCMNGIEIDFRAGHGEAGTDVPDGLKRAILLLVGHWFEFRSAFDAGSQPVSFPGGFERVVARYREHRL